MMAPLNEDTLVQATTADSPAEKFGLRQLPGNSGWFSRNAIVPNLKFTI